ncbi:MAG TPA: hypothetical protein DGD08_15910 [Gemmatimonas aurantiaca]|uniref:Hydrolase n=2 Tax=Gemmatimonas aurantiaca TaxID=173480 RepID=C1A5Z6_GEMAT|nr:haloacid dehalogenase-like hydrolase [Gemmatimonas aurantiaca]BAH37656.1 hypothetical protein GAU_0614 [Gemmatimonas aurantiaca T-27]HCT58691.1 hypothetical protein [Gemmatimonas aurantiaca]
MKVVLFDIDGTLLRTDGAGRRAMERAMQALHGAVGDTEYRYDGKTDRQIIREQMREAGIAEDAILAQMDVLIARYLENLADELRDRPDQAVLCAGVLPLLDRLRGRDDVTLGLLTGNVQQGARQKLAAVGVAFDQFVVNAFGCDHEHRPELPSIARGRAESYLGRAIAGDQLVIIGDTPADIHCGRSIGVRAIGVATGRYSVEALAEHDPAAVFVSLEDTDAVVEAMLS